LTKLLPYNLFEKRIYILALGTASPGNQHCDRNNKELKKQKLMKLKRKGPCD